MRIKFLPQRRDDTLTLFKQGDVLTVNGDDLDFSSVLEGNSLPVIDDDSNDPIVPPHQFVPTARRENGELIVSVFMPHGPNPPEHVAFPTDLIDVQDGPVTLPTDEA